MRNGHIVIGVKLMRLSPGVCVTAGCRGGGRTRDRDPHMTTGRHEQLID